MLNLGHAASPSVPTLPSPSTGTPQSLVSHLFLCDSHRQPSPHPLRFAGSPTSKSRKQPTPRSRPPQELSNQHLGVQLTVHSYGLSPHLQDEMELGYVQAPHKTLPVVFDSPRNGELQGFPYKRILVSGRGALQP